ncbi:hypothetical protein P3X83_43230, partial [Spongiactinospora sp. TRM90649]|nr:hypothetical protein [Spongiactinospora sp. TRM90649]
MSWTPLEAGRASLDGHWLVAGADDRLKQALRSLGASVSETVDPDVEYAGVLSTLDAAATLELLQILEVDAPVWAVTRGAVSVGRSDNLTDPVAAQVWGLGRVAALELPDRWGGLIDLPAELDERAISRLGWVLTGGSGEDQVAVRASGVYGRRL